MTPSDRRAKAVSYLYHLIREMEAEASLQDSLASKESDIILRNNHIRIAGLLRRAIAALNAYRAQLPS